MTTLAVEDCNNSYMIKTHENILWLSRKLDIVLQKETPGSSLTVDLHMNAYSII